MDEVDEENEVPLQQSRLQSYPVLLFDTDSFASYQIRSIDGFNRFRPSRIRRLSLMFARALYRP
jgi:hypothetical protein